MTVAFRAFLAAVVLSIVPSAAVLGVDEATTVLVFHLRHRTPIEATQVVQPLLSESGTLTFQSQRPVITIEDRRDVVERVAKVLGEFDREPARYRLRVDLLEGLRDAASATGAPVAVSAKVERLFPYAAYQRLASAVVEGRVGERGGVELGRAYSLRFFAGSASLIPLDAEAGGAVAPREGPGQRAVSAGPQPTVLPNRRGVRDAPDVHTPVASLSSRFRLQQLTLLKRHTGEAGAEEMIEVFRSNVTMGPGQSFVVGASGSEESERALVLIIEAEPVEDR